MGKVCCWFVIIGEVVLCTGSWPYSCALVNLFVGRGGGGGGGIRELGVIRCHGHDIYSKTFLGTRLSERRPLCNLLDHFSKRRFCGLKSGRISRCNGLKRVHQVLV